MAPNLQDVDHIHVLVADRAAAEEWYARVLGLHRVPELVSWSLYFSDPDGNPYEITSYEYPDIEAALARRGG